MFDVQQVENDVGGKRKLDMIGVYLSPHLKISLEKWAEEERRSVSNLAAILLEEAVKERAKKQNEEIG